MTQPDATAQQSPGPTGPLSKSRGDMLVERTMTWFSREVELGTEAYTVDGPAFGQVDRSPWSTYQKLMADQAAGSPDYWQNPAAIADLTALSQQFGPPAAITTPPFGVEARNQPGRQLSALEDVQQTGGDLGYPALPPVGGMM